MREKGENSARCVGKSTITPDEIMISPLVSKVNPSHLAVVGWLEQATLGTSSKRGLGYCTNEIRTSSQECRNAHQREIQGSDGILGTLENGPQQPLG